MILKSTLGDNILRLFFAPLLAALLLPANPVGAAAHDIPSDVTVQAFVKPEGRRLALLVRVPLGAMRDIDFPLTPDGYLDIEKLTPQLADTASLWLSGFISMYEGE